ncbi:MAG: DUF5131 family protein [Dehalococcoidia bacterium]|jgi:protein gp37
MSKIHHTDIEWDLNPDGTPGYAWNPITGCLNIEDGKCKGGGFPCYAYKIAHGRTKPLYLRHGVKALIAGPAIDDRHSPSFYDGLDDPFYPRFWRDHVHLPNSRKPRGVFVCDMSDLFGIGIPEEWTRDVFQEIHAHPRDRFYLLTKQYKNLLKFSPFPGNCWVGGTSVNSMLLTQLWKTMKDVIAPVKFVSIEPLQSWNMSAKDTAWTLKDAGIKWVIIGGQSKPEKLPDILAVQTIVLAADAAGAKVFLKDSLFPLIDDNENIKAPYYMLSKDKDGYVQGLRQEMPVES